jgi:hypothetical protein
MKMTRMRLAAASAGVIGVVAAAALGQARTGGTATYWMSADTVSGMGAMMGGGGGAGAIMSAMRGRSQSSYAHNLMLQLGSSGRAAGEPAAEHLPPAGLQAGASLPLVTPRGAAAPQPTGNLPRNMERPKGRMLIYWGCGEHVRDGQPVVIDFASMTAGKVPPAFAAANFKAMIPPNAASHATYGEWPNARSQTRVPAGGSLVGEHVVKGNYSPEIRFTLGAAQDFLAPVTLTSNTAAASGSVPLVWRPVPGARAWLASTMGAGANGDMVMWSSSETQSAAMALDYLASSEIARLVQQKVLMPATADRCTVPTEVARAAPQSMLSLVALGGDADFAPPKPAGAPASWRPQWNVKLRTKSTHMGLLGMNMAEMMGQSGNDGNEAGQDQPTSRKGKLKKGLKGLLGQ